MQKYQEDWPVAIQNPSHLLREGPASCRFWKLLTRQTMTWPTSKTRISKRFAQINDSRLTNRKKWNVEESKSFGRCLECRHMYLQAPAGMRGSHMTGGPLPENIIFSQDFEIVTWTEGSSRILDLHTRLERPPDRSMAISARLLNIFREDVAPQFLSLSESDSH